jgi:cytochrome P450
MSDVMASVAASEPAAQPLTGHLTAFRRHRLELLDACIDSPSDVVRLRIRTPAYLLKRAEDVKRVFLDAQHLYAKDRRNIGARANRIFGDGLMTSSGQRHRQMRERVQPAFRHDQMGPLGEVAVREVDAMVDRWGDGAEIDLAGEMERFALQSLTRSIFGVEEGPELTALQQGVVARRHSMTRGLLAIAPLPAFLPLAVSPQRRRSLRRLDETIARLITTREEEGPNGDLLSFVIDAEHGEAAATDPRRVRDQALTFTLAAYENVARALTWTLLALARQPEVAHRMTREVDVVLADRPPRAEDLEALRYTRMTLAESLRLWPPNALLNRVALSDDVLPTGTRVESGSKLILSPYVVHRDPAYYPDPLRFDPERFSEEQSRERPRFSYFPFGGGPRVCIGRGLAIQQCTLALARLSQRVQIDLAGEPASYICGCLPEGFGPRMRATAVAATHPA